MIFADRFHGSFLALSMVAALVVALGSEGQSLDQGVALFEQGKHQQARTHFESLARKQPANGAAFYWIGRAALALNDTEGAMESLEKAVKLSPRLSEYHLWLGRAYGVAAMNANVLSQATLARKVRKAFETAVALDAANLDARSGLVEFYVLAPGLMGGSEAKALEQAAEIGRRDALRGVRETAKIHRMKGRFDEAEKTYLDGLRKHGNDRDLRRELAYLHQQRKDWAKAHQVLSALVAEDPDDMGAHYQVGRNAALSGQFLDAGEQALRKYLQHRPSGEDPPLKWAHVRLAAVYEKSGRKSLAKAEYEQALKIDPQMKAAREGLTKLR